jgi:hypothetical protein
METRGYPVKVRAKAQAYDVATAQRLSEISEDLTGVHYDLLDGHQRA